VPGWAGGVEPSPAGDVGAPVPARERAPRAGRLAELVAGPGLAAVLAVLGASGFGSAFDAADLLRPVLAGAAGGAAVSAVVTGGRRGAERRRMAVATLAAIAVLVPLAMVASGGGPTELVDGVRHGIRTILTSAVPTPAEPQVLVVPYVVAAAASFLGAEIAQRSRAAAGPVVPSVAALVLGLVFGLEGSRPDGWIVPAWAAVAGVVIGLRRRAQRQDRLVASTSDGPGAGPGPGRGGPGTRTLVPAVLVAVAVAALANAVGPSLPGAEQRERFEARDLVDQPTPPQQLANPLMVIAGLQEGADDTVFTAETSAAVERWRLASLDVYNGERWSSGVSYVPAGNQLPDPPADEGGADGDRVTQTIEPGEALEGQWLPVVDRPVEISVDGVLYDIESGTLLASDPDLPASYEATSIVNRPDTAALSSAAAAGDEEAERALELPANVPEDITAAAEEITAGSASAYMRATAIERFLAQSTADVPFRLALERPPTGHSFGHLRCFLFNTERCGRQGSTEQFVAAYALLARAADLPTRIVVGFTSSGSAGRDEITAHEATAWTEVKFDGIGWVAFNPVPNPDVTNTPPPADVAGGGGAPDSSTPTTIAEPEDDSSDDGAAGEESASAADDGPALWLVAAVVGVVVLLVLPALVRWRRRRLRRGGATPGERIAGAWAEAVDQLARSGVRPPPTVAVRDVVRAGRVSLPDVAGPLAPLGDLVNRARFARGRAPEADAVAAWELSDAFADRRRRGRSLRQRVREWFAVRSVAARQG
jgi:hypothetical protein